MNRWKTIKFLNDYTVYTDTLDKLSGEDHLLISTLNSYSLILSQKDELFKQALVNSDVLIPDGISIVLASRILYGHKFVKIAGADIFFHEMQRLNASGGRCFFLGSSAKILTLILQRTKREYPNITVKTLSPPFKMQFTDAENAEMIEAVNAFQPDVLFIGMTAPKQEKWAFSQFGKLNAKHVCSIGAVFDFFAETTKRAPQWMIRMDLEWLYRFLKEPRRMWRRYLIGNFLFIWIILKMKLMQKSSY